MLGWELRGEEVHDGDVVRLQVRAPSNIRDYGIGVRRQLRKDPQAGVERIGIEDEDDLVLCGQDQR